MMVSHVKLQLTKYNSCLVRVHHKNLGYWTCFEMGRLMFFVLAFIILLDSLLNGAFGLLTPLFFVWVLEKFWGWEALKHSRLFNYVEKIENG